MHTESLGGWERENGGREDGGKENGAKTITADAKRRNWSNGKDENLRMVLKRENLHSNDIFFK
jgi:hypothetical protein